MTKEFILGIDEAGRGPVLGSMVYACVVWDKELEDEIIKRYSFDDSKKLDDTKRREIFEKMKKDDDIKSYTSILSASEISASMIRREGNIVNLNELAYISAGRLLNNAIEDGYNIVKVFADTVGLEKTYESRLYSISKKKDIDFKAEKKADSKYKIVSAASIVAKVTRDNIIKDWIFIENNKNIVFSKEVGSGYPSDPYTKEWLRLNFNNVFGYPNLVRFSWETIKKPMFADGVKLQFEDYIDNDKEREGKKQCKFNEEERNDVFERRIIVEKNFYKKYGLISTVNNKSLF